jgi:chromate transport protein ChrA
VVLLVRGYEAWYRSPFVVAALQGALAAAVGIILSSAWLLLRPYFTARTWVRMTALAAGSFALSAGLAAPPIRVLALAALIGWFWRERPAS